MQDRSQVVILDLLLSTGDFQKFSVGSVEFFTIERNPQRAETSGQRVTAGVTAENQTACRNADALRSHDFVRHRGFDHTVLMDSRFVRKGILPNDRFVRLDVRAGKLTQKLA